MEFLQIYELFFLSAQILIEPSLPQPASGTLAAPVSGNTVIARKRLRTDYIKHT